MSVLSQIRTKPWLPDDNNNQPRDGDRETGRLADKKVGLWIFLAVVSSLFLILANAYVARRGFEDWHALPELGLLWFNTGILILSSIALQWSRLSASRGYSGAVKLSLLVGGVFACVFLLGQLYAWQQFSDMGYFVSTNPANSFFYLITGIHGLHLLGGLVALLRATLRTWGEWDSSQVYLSVSLCSVYWHFLLLVWLIFFGLMFFS
jgi:cytochrome c oxidase subunit 3